MTWLMLLALLSGCASLGGGDDKKSQSELKITDSSHEEKPQVASQHQTGVADYTFEKQSGKAEWHACLADGARHTVLMVPSADLGAGDAFCKSWAAQTFLAAGYSVVGVNRPGQGQTTGDTDFSGPRSQAAIVAGANAAKATVKALKPYIGVWGFSAGVPAAAFAAKKIPGLRWVIFGSGIYDAEVTMNTTQDKALKSQMESVISGDDGFETRSIAWDNSGLPKKVILYHGKNDNSVYPTQAESFRDSLATAEYDVSLQVIDGVGNDIPAGPHRQILEIVVKALQ